MNLFIYTSCELVWYISEDLQGESLKEKLSQAMRNASEI